MKKVVKNILYILLIILLALVVGYFVVSCVSMNSKVEKDVFLNSMYKDKTEESFIYFGDYTNSILYVNDVYYYPNEVDYQDNVFYLPTEESTFSFIAMSKDRLFSKDFKRYFYFYGVSQ